MVVMGNPLGDVKVVNSLLQMKADPKLVDAEGWNCIHWAAYHSNVGAVEVMMEGGAVRTVMDLMLVENKDKLTPLDLAIKHGNNDFAAWLRHAIK